MAKERDSFDFWYAVNNTDVKVMPERHLETFGTTVLNYHLITELMDSVDQIRIREGRLEAGQPQIITPDAYSQTAMEGFGDEARQYVEWLKEHEQDIRVLQYGYKLKQESYSEHIVTDTLDPVVERVKDAVAARGDPLSAVVVGVDDPWDVCLVRLFWEVIQKSAVFNIREMQQQNLFDNDKGVPRGVRNDVEAAFKAANQNAELIQSLGAKLRALGLFSEYEDRFFSLVKSKQSK
ncbi:MAG: hypothetical protein HN341_10725 [Verrucomicrobia bacterium]|jgi:hypothetical protein|nr:hypothetical protein [Verrucomicrobiota bacterium]